MIDIIDIRIIKEYVSVPIARSIIWKVLSTNDMQVISPYTIVVIVVIIK